MYLYVLLSSLYLGINYFEDIIIIKRFSILISEA